jgi:hypothetical protein
MRLAPGTVWTLIFIDAAFVLPFPVSMLILLLGRERIDSCRVSCLAIAFLRDVHRILNRNVARKPTGK